MPLPTSSITIGDCYRTATGQERKVVNIFAENGVTHVRYFSRGGNAQNGWDWGGTKASPPSLQTFADAVDQAIPCPVATPPSGFTLNGLRTGGQLRDLDDTRYPFSKGGRVTFKRTAETEKIADGDGIWDSRHPTSPVWVVSDVTLDDEHVQMELHTL
ncbi:hypothetical protein DMC25_00510 [Caulobacter sp. D4A]|nr:hypothetical protein DMC18_20355 [Caulobacter sp. D5]PXA95598.1 hypothetical protein DMC25_00510 [Caulobacter sp. D4A]